MQDKLIDIEKVIASKNPSLLKWSPSFLINYLKRILHQEEINQIIWEHQDKSGYNFAKAIVEHFKLDLHCFGKENIPKDGGFIFACNHPLGGMDAMALIEEIYPIRPDMKFIVNDILLNVKPLEEFFVGVNKHGSTAARSLSKVNELFASDQAIFVFPAGLVSRKTKGEVRDLEWKKTFITRAKRFDKPVIPVYLDGKLSSFFYGLANFRKSIGIKANIEMLYLVNELFKQKNERIEIHFGKAIPANHFDSNKSDLEWAQEVKEACYALANNKIVKR